MAFEQVSGIFGTFAAVGTGHWAEARGSLECEGDSHSPQLHGPCSWPCPCPSLSKVICRKAFLCCSDEPALATVSRWFLFFPWPSGYAMSWIVILFLSPSGIQVSRSTPFITPTLNLIVCSFGRHPLPLTLGRPHPLHLNNRRPRADSCCGKQEPRTDRCDEDELIPFLRE